MAAAYTLVVIAALAAVATVASGPAVAASEAPNASVAPVGGAVPQDVDGDGRYEDLNANGEWDFDDVVVFFGHMDDPAVRDHTDAYDFNGNGEIDFDDVVTLFNRDYPPVARAQVAPQTVTAGEPVRFDARASSDPDGTLEGVDWEFGDGTGSQSSVANHTYDEPGVYNATLRVHDHRGRTDTATTAVRVRPRDDTVRSDERVTAYYTSWARYDRDYQPADVPLDRITHLNYAFLDVTENGTVVLGDDWGDRQNLRAFEERSENHSDTTFLLSIGGWSYSDDFSDAALTEQRRQRFARTAVALVREYGFDGVDIDWEYPGGGGRGGNVVRDGDPRNFTLLLEAVRDELDRAEREDGREYELTVAVSADPEKASRLEVAEISDEVDAINVMTYDYHGSWDQRTNHNAPLYAPPEDPAAGENRSVHASMQFWASQPVDREKVSVGLPFYGRSYAQVSPTNDGRYQPFSGTPSGTYGSQGVYEYWDVRRNLNASGSSYEYHWDDEAKVPFLYSQEREVFVSFDNRRSVRLKTAYAERRGWGGVTIWALSHDRNATLLAAVDRELGQRADGSGDADGSLTASE